MNNILYLALYTLFFLTKKILQQKKNTILKKVFRNETKMA